MNAPLNAAATDPLPAFITAPGSTDVLMSFMTVALIGAVFAVGVLFFRLHTLPERLAHKSHKLQVEIVSVLGLISLFTHQHIFWIIGLILAFIDFPDFGTPVRRITRALETMAGIQPPPALTDASEAEVKQIEVKAEEAKVHA